MNSNEIPNYFTEQIFFEISFKTAEKKVASYYVTIAMLIFSCVKITCNHTKVHLVFAWCSYSIGL